MKTKSGVNSGRNSGTVSRTLFTMIDFGCTARGSVKLQRMPLGHQLRAMKTLAYSGSLRITSHQE